MSFQGFVYVARVFVWSWWDFGMIMIYPLHFQGRNRGRLAQNTNPFGCIKLVGVFNFKTK